MQCTTWAAVPDSPAATFSVGKAERRRAGRTDAPQASFSSTLPHFENLHMEDFSSETKWFKNSHLRKPQKNRQENSEKERQAEEISTHIELYHKAVIIKAVCFFSNGLMKWWTRESRNRPQYVWGIWERIKVEFQVSGEQISYSINGLGATRMPFEGKKSSWIYSSHLTTK